MNNTAAKTQELFYRDGRPFTGKPMFTEKGKPYFAHVDACTRCGGQGGAEQWKFTGYTCYRCGGNGKEPHETIDRLYTAEQLQKMNAAQEKRNAKRAAATAEKAAALEAERSARREAFATENREYFDSVLAVCGVSSFAHEIITTAMRLANLTADQRAALDRMVAETKQRAQQTFVGTVGERRDFACKLEKFFDWSRPKSYPPIYKYCHIMRDENGNVVKYIGSKILGGVSWNRELEFYEVDREEVLKFKATVTEHETYKDEKQTVVARPKMAE